MNLFEQKVYNYIQSHALIEPGNRLVVGVSGGADSVCLLCVLKALMPVLQIPSQGIVVVHVHHGIRGAEADHDAVFTKTLCERLGFLYQEYQKDIPAYAKRLGLSVEEAGREYRYQCMEELVMQLKFDKIAVAHNQDDVAETVLFHMMRGSGLNGLAGIAASRGNIIRPLLGVSRMEIEAYLADCGQDFCQDSTNTELTYARNKIRHSILPVMKELNGRVVEHICQLAQDAAQSYEYIHAQALEQCDSMEKEDAFGRTVTLSVAELYKVGPVLQEHIVWEAIGQVALCKKDITRRHIQAVAALIYQDSGSSVQLPYGIHARRNYGELIVSDKVQTMNDYRFTIAREGDYEVPEQGTLSVSIEDFIFTAPIPKKTYTKFIDYAKIKGTLCVRTPEDGDYIVIDTDGKTKKLSRVFIDAKVDRTKRADWPVIACGHEIVWVVGLRFSPAYHVDEQTNKVLKIQYEGKGDQDGTKD